MTAPIVFDMVTYPFEEMGDYPYDDLPNRVILREIDFKIEDNELKFYFSGGEDIALGPQPDAFEQLINKVCDKNYIFKTPAPALQDEYASLLSLRNGELSFVVYKLSKTRKWQFASEGLPASVGAAGKKFAFEVYRLDATGYTNRDRGGKARDHCVVIYFIADGVSPKNSHGEYAYPLNLHVNLIHAQGRRRLMPIIIDPDVRYPGGSG